MKRTKILLVALATIVCGQMKAQSADYARSLISSGRDGEAARVIRALAERGDAEGQYLAATFFLEGRGGMNKSEQQAVKYFKLSADQGYDEAIKDLIVYYVKRGKWEDAFMNATKYCTRHPYLLKKYPGYIKATCMLAGRGTIQNEDKGWEILEENEDFSYAQFSFENSWEAYKQRHPEKFTVYDTVEQMPSFPGGQSALFKYLSDEIIYPAVCINNKIQGRVIVSFIVERDGSITEAKIARSIDPALDKEALRVVRNMPNWIPGKRHGEKVRVKYTIPVTFRL
jgi:TonB family protein